MSDGGIAGTGSCGATIDDGTGENSLGNGVGKIVWGVQFTGGGYCSVSQVEVAFGAIGPATPCKIFLLSDPNQDGDPIDSQVLAVVNGVTANEDTNTINTFNIGPVAVGYKYFAAVLIENMPLLGNLRFPARFDATAPHAVRSWIASTFPNNANPFNGSNRNELSSINFPGDFMVRTVGNGNPCSTTLKACRADVAPPPNGNGVVNVDDLLAVINSWGPNGNPNTRPQGDVAPTPTGNCLVNVDDLLAVINSWGPCTPPANNACASRIVVGNGSTTWNNDYATTDGPVAGSCVSNMTRDIWYNYVATCTGAATMDTVGGTGNNDTILAVYQGGACGGALIACNDDINFPGGNAYSRLSIGVVAGQTYKIRIGSFGANGPTGDGRLNISCVSNDSCAGAAPMTTSATGTLVGSVLQTVATCNSISTGKGRWHSVEGDGSTMTISMCNSPSNITDLWAGKLSVYCGDSCNDLFCVTAASANAVCANPDLSNMASVTFCTYVGKVYYVLVHSDEPPLALGYALSVSTDGTPCGTQALCSAIPPPANDECTAAITITDTGTFPINVPYDSTTASSSAPPAPGGVDCSGTAYSQFTKDQWFKFTPTVTALYDLGMCGTTAVHDSMLAIYTGACGALVEFACNDDGCGGGGFSFLTRTLTGGTTYTIRIGVWDNTAGGPATLVITKPVCGNGILEPGEQCDNVLPVPPGAACVNCLLEICAFPCVGTAECEPCLVDGVSDTCNGGCLNGSQVAPGPYFTQTIVAGQRVCGTCSTYVPAAPEGHAVDGDHWIFIPTVTGNHLLQTCSEFGGAVNFFINPIGNVTNCGTGSAFVNTVGTGNQVLVPGVPSIQTRPLTAGLTYAVRIRPAAAPAVPCNPGGVGNRYSFVITVVP